MLRRSSVVIVLAFALAIAGCSPYGDKLEFGSGEVYYTDGATQEEAQKLGDWLKESGYFADDGDTRSVQLRKEGDLYQFRVVVQDAEIDKPETAQSFFLLGSYIRSQVLDGAPLEVHLTDEYMETKHVIETGEKLQFGSGEVYFSDGVTKEEAQKLGDWLTENGFFPDDSVTRTMQLRKEGDLYQFRIVVQNTEIDKPETADAFREVGDLIRTQVLAGAPLEVHLTDEMMATKHVIETTEQKPR